jgi:hypothetical protein
MIEMGTFRLLMSHAFLAQTCQTHLFSCVSNQRPIGNGRNWLSMCHSWQLFPFAWDFTPLNEVEWATSFICVGLVFVDIHKGLNIIFGNHNVETSMKGLKG